MAKVVVFGGTGSLGRRIAEHLTTEGARAIIDTIAFRYWS